MLAIFTPAYNPQHWLQTKDRFVPDVSPEQKAAIERYNAELQKQIAPLRDRLAQLRKPYEQKLIEKKLLSITEPLREDLKAALAAPESKRTPVEQYLVRKLAGVIRVSAEEAQQMFTPDERSQYQAVLQEIQDLEVRLKSYGKIQALYDTDPPPATYLNRRGNHDTPAAEVEPGFLT